MGDFYFNTAGSIKQKFGGTRQLGEFISDFLGKDRTGEQILFVTDTGILKLGLAQHALASLEKVGFKTTIFSEIESDPSVTTVLSALKRAKKIKVSAIIGFGGGSSMDVAKLISFLAISNQCLDDIYGVNQIKGNRLPLVLIPTTAGTGSEVTPVAIVTTNKTEKKGIVSPVLLPDLAILDAELTLGLPPRITAMTGIDAIVHAIEAYTSTNPNNNPISQMMAKQALWLLSANITDAVLDGTNIQTRSNMLLGAMLAGQAFANSPVAAVHALAYPIGSLFHIPHGLSNSLVLPHVMRFNAEHCADQYLQLAPIIFPNMDLSGSTQKICTNFIEQIESLIKKLGLETKLSQVDIQSSEIEKLAEEAMKQTRLLVNNPRQVAYKDAMNIYNNAF